MTDWPVMTRRCPVSRRRRHPANTRQWRSSWPSVWPSHSLCSSSSSLSLSFDVSTFSDWRTPSTRRHLAAVQHASEDHFRHGVSNRSAPSTPLPATLLLTTSCRNAAAAIFAKDYGDDSDRIVIPDITPSCTTNGFCMRNISVQFAYRMR